MGAVKLIASQAALLLVALFVGATLVLPYNGGYVLAYVLMGLALVQLLALLAARGRWEMGAAGWCLVGAFVLIAIAFSLNRDAPMMVNFLFLVAIVPLTSWLARFAAPDSARIVSWLALVGTMLSATTAIYETILLGNKRAEGWWSDPIWSAEAALILGFLSLMAFPTMRSPWRYLLLAGPVLAIGIVILSGSRGVLLAAPVIVLALLVTTFRPWWKQILALAIALVIAGAVVLPTMPYAMKRVERAGVVVIQLLTTGTIKERSAGARVEFWKAGTQAFLASPITGHGWSDHLEAAYQYLPDKGKAYNQKGSSLRGNAHLHADILDLGVSGGILGLFAYGLILLAPLLGALRSVRDSQFGARLTGAIVLTTGYAACGLTYLMFGYEFHTTLYVCLAAIVLGFCRDEPLGRKPSPVAP